MKQNQLAFDQLMLEDLEREKRKRWAQGLEPGSLTIEDATAKVAGVFAEQEYSIPSPGEPGEAFFIGLLSLGKIFGDLAPSFDQVNDAISCAGEDYYVYSALRLLEEISSKDAYPNLVDWKLRLYLGLEKRPDAQ